MDRTVRATRSLDRALLAVACALALGVIRPASPRSRDVRTAGETQRRVAAAEAKRARRRARNLNQETTP